MKERKDLEGMKEHTIHSGGAHLHRGNSEDPGMPWGRKVDVAPAIWSWNESCRVDEHGSGH